MTTTLITVSDVSCANCGGTCELYLIPDVCFHILFDAVFGREAWICLGCLAARVGMNKATFALGMKEGEGTFMLLQLEQQMRGVFHLSEEVKRKNYKWTYSAAEWPPDPYVLHLLLSVPASPASDRYAGQTITLEQMKQMTAGKEKLPLIVTPEMIEVETPQPVRAAPKVGRNDPCPCGSGKKYKKCHAAAAA